MQMQYKCIVRSYVKFESADLPHWRTEPNTSFGSRDVFHPEGVKCDSHRSLARVSWGQICIQQSYLKHLPHVRAVQSMQAAKSECVPRVRPSAV